MIKKYVLLIVFIGIIFFIPSNVKAETTVTMCKSGCDYTNFDEVINDIGTNILDNDLTIEVRDGEYDANNKDFIAGLLPSRINSLTIKGVSKEKTELVNCNLSLSINDKLKLAFEDISIETSDFGYGGISNVILKNVNMLTSPSIVNQKRNGYVYVIREAENIVLDNVTFDINNQNNESEISGLFLRATNVDINNLTINSNYHLNKGLSIDNTENATINNLTVNNSEIGLYVHRKINDNINSSVTVNNSNLLDNTCSSFNILDDNDEIKIGVMLNDKYLIAYNLPYSLKKNYQVVFNSGNKLNCAVASGTDTNTFISGDNVWSKTPNSYTYDEINYDNLTDTTQNVNKGTVDVGKKYKGTVTIEVGSSVDDVTAFLEKLDLSGVTWTVKDESISKIENGKILGIKEGTTTITGVSSDGLTTYEIEVNVIKNPTTSSIMYVGIGVILILVLGTILYIVYRIKIVVED